MDIRESIFSPEHCMGTLKEILVHPQITPYMQNMIKMQ